MAIASFIIHAYKCRAVLNAQNADVAQNTVGVTHLRFYEYVKTDIWHLVMLQTDTCVHGRQNTMICMSLFCRSQALTFCSRMLSWPSQNNEIQMRVLLVVRKYASVECIDHCFCLSLKNVLATHCTLTTTRTIFTTPRRNCYIWRIGVANGCSA